VSQETDLIEPRLASAGELRGRGAIMRCFLGLVMMVMSLSLTPIVMSQTPSMTPLPPVEVTATRLEQPIERTTSAVTVITAAEIAQQQAVSVADVLRNVPGLTIIESGSIGTTTSVFTRGSNSNQTLVLIDGARGNNPFDGRFDFANFLVDNIERIEVVRGSQSTLYGSDAIGGVINIITKRGEGTPRFGLFGELGSQESYRFGADASGAVNLLNYAVSVSRLGTDGFFAHDQYHNTTASGRGEVKLGSSTTLDISTRYFDADKDLPGIAGRGFNSTQEQEEESVFLTARLKHLFAPWWDAHVMYSRGDVERNFRDRETASGSRLDTILDIAELQQNFRIKEIDIVTLGFEWRQEEAENLSFGPFAPDPLDRTRRNVAVFAQNVLQPLEGLLIVTGWRYDDDNRFGSYNSLRASAAYLFKPTGTKIRGTVGTGFKAPSLADLFLSIPPFSFPNPDLKPEKSESYEVGIEQSFWQERLRFEVTVFRLVFDDLIVFDFLTNSPQNINRAESEGIEAAFVVTPGWGLSARGSYTYMDARDLSRDDQLLRRPRHQGAVNVNYSPIRPLNLNMAVTVAGSRRDVDPMRFVNFDNNGYTRVDLAAFWDLNVLRGILDRLRIYGRIENLTDEKYEEAAGFPAPGFRFMTGLQARF
jgi:vitamin B12 transporter